jgi:DNA-binding MarR family transcriptional regulator
MTATSIEPAHLARILKVSAEYQLSANQLQTLCELSASGAKSLTMGTIAAKLNVSSAAITTIADVLEDHDYIIRQFSRTDRRQVWLTLTEFGNQTLADILGA